MKIGKTLITTFGLSALLASGGVLAHQHERHGGKHGHQGYSETDTALAQSAIAAQDAVARAEKDSGAHAHNLDLDMYRGRAVYEIELFDDKQEYEIRVDAVSGEIISRKSEYDDELPRIAAISLQQAIATAERELGGKVVDAEREGRSSGLVYEIKLVKEDGSRIHADISAEDGKVLRHMEKMPHHGGRGQDMPPVAPGKS